MNEKNKAKAICDRVGNGIPYVMVLGYILDKGMSTISKITDGDIENIPEQPWITKELSQRLARTAREVVLNCDMSDIVRLFKSDWCCAGEVYDPDLDMFVTDTDDEEFDEDEEF